jgi:hypothetical protein
MGGVLMAEIVLGFPDWEYEMGQKNLATSQKIKFGQ